MSGVIRDFSQGAIEHLKDIIKQNVDDEDQFFFFDWIEDFSMEDLDIHDYMNDVDTYHAHMVDKHDISIKKFDVILEKVNAVDISYATRLNSIYEGLSSFNSKIMNVSAMINPGAVALNQDAYTELLNGIEKIHTDKMEAVKKEVENSENQLDDVLREIPWYEKALNFAGGVAVEAGKNTIEGAFYIPYAICDGVFGTHINEGLDSMLTKGEDFIVENLVTDKQAYYYGKAAGDVLTIAQSSKLLAKGLITIGGGLAGMGIAFVATSTGILIPVGVTVEAGSIALVAEGVLETQAALAIAAKGFNNFGDNIKMAQSSASRVNGANLQSSQGKAASSLSSAKNNVKNSSSVVSVKTLQHIFHGNLNSKGLPSGYHKPSIMSKAKIFNQSAVDKFGVYKATVEMNGKSKFSTFFPDSWNRVDVINEIKNARSGVKFVKEGWYVGKASNGMPIKMWINQNGLVDTAFPIYTK